MMEQVLKKFVNFEKPKAGQKYEFNLAGTTYRIRLIDSLKLKKYVEFVPKLEFVVRLTKGWRDERIEIFRDGDLYLLLHIPKNASRDLDIPFILIEKKIARKNGGVKWEPISWLYYHFYNFDGIYLTVRESVEFIIEEAIKNDWEIKLLYV
jgi:hypothetical protein